ncbi:MAG TPA: hypothetical protein VFA98_11595 [Thermoanaerobaculia bacterium]|nr:hypothetical protein [Thermoanaerobaculia bacterium]
MGAHIIEGEFQSDKYPETPRGCVPLKTSDKTAQDLLWDYSQRRRPVDAEFSSDLEFALKDKGFDPKSVILLKLNHREAMALTAAVDIAMRSGKLLEALGATDDDLALIETFVKLKTFVGTVQRIEIK